MLIVVDVSNLYYSVKRKFGESSKLDYQKFLEFLPGDHEIVKAIAYGAEMDGRAIHFRSALERMGFEVKYKSPKVFRDESSGREDRKADWDVGMAMDLVRALDDLEFDIVVLATADGDLAPCIQFLRERGKEVVVVASGISHELRTSANQYYEIPKEMIS